MAGIGRVAKRVPHVQSAVIPLWARLYHGTRVQKQLFHIRAIADTSHLCHVKIGQSLV